MGHRAEKQMYGSMKNYKRVKEANKKDSRVRFAEPEWQKPKRADWKLRHAEREV